MSLLDVANKYFANHWFWRAVYSRLLGERRRSSALVEIAAWFPDNLGGAFSHLNNPVQHFRERETPYFHWGSDDPAEILSSLDAEARRNLVNKAEACRKGVWTFRGGPPLESTEEIPWRKTNKKLAEWHRDLHRLEWLVDIALAGIIEKDDSAFTYIAEALQSWVQTSPPTSAHWEDPFEVAQRSETLLWLFFLCRRQPAMPDEAIGLLLACLAASGHLLYATLEYHSPNNHLFAEAIRLAEIGVLLPEAKDAGVWITTGRSVLTKELEKQVLEDGMHAERSVFYHRIMLDALLQWRLVIKRNNRTPEPLLDQRLNGMLRFQRHMQRPDGAYPQFNDGYADDSYIRLDAGKVGQMLLNEGAVENRRQARTLLAGTARSTAAAPKDDGRMHLYPQAGFFIQTDHDAARHMAFRCGDIAYRPSPSHVHADPLGIEIFDQFPFLVSSGTFSFDDNAAIRNQFRATAAHNCLTVNDKNAAEVYGLFGVGRLPVVERGLALTGRRTAIVEASHDGYRSAGCDRHTRTLITLPDGWWVVLDTVEGPELQSVSLYWHLAPGLSCELSEKRAVVLRDSAPAGSIGWYSNADMQPTIEHGGDKAWQGWYSDTSGARISRDTLVVSSHMPLPATIATSIAGPKVRKGSAGTVRHAGSADPVTLGKGVQIDSDGTLAAGWQHNGHIVAVVRDGTEIRIDGLTVRLAAQPGSFIAEFRDGVCFLTGVNLSGAWISGRRLDGVTVNNELSGIEPHGEGWVVK